MVYSFGGLTQSVSAIRAATFAGLAAAVLFIVGQTIKRIGKKSRQRQFIGNDHASPLPQSQVAWKVLRCASKSKSSRDQEGGNRSAQCKFECSSLEVKKEGVIGTRRGLIKTTLEEDFNNYRTTGHTGRFVAGTLDRAVSLVTASAYEALRGALPGISIQYGDLGENLLLLGPSLDAGIDLDVGSRLQIGDHVQLELTEANKPCARLNHVKWASQVKKAVGDERWWESKVLPLGKHRPGGRGWLCKVLVEGMIKPGDEVQKL